MYNYVNVQKSHRCDEQMYDALGHAGVVRCVHNNIINYAHHCKSFNGKIERERREERGERDYVMRDRG